MTRTDAVLAAKQIDRQLSTAAEVMPPGHGYITLFAERAIVEALSDSCGYRFSEHDDKPEGRHIFSSSKDAGEVFVTVQGSEPING